MTTLYAHIGSEKCGSSLVEFMFLTNVEILRILKDHGIHSTPHFHIALRNVVVDTQWDDGVHGRLRAQMLAPMRKNKDKVFVSEELLLGLEHRPGKSNPLERRIDFTRRLFEGFDPIRPILVIRRQDKFIESHYNQQVKRGETRDFDEIMEDLPIDNYRWDVIADSWAEAFGSENLTVIPFETSVLEASNGPKNILAAMFRALGLNVDIPMEGMPVVNPSLRPELLEAQREINDKFEPEVAHRIADILARNVKKVPGAAQGLFADDKRQALLDRFADSNKRLFEAYIPDCSPEEYLTIKKGI